MKINRMKEYLLDVTAVEEVIETIQETPPAVLLDKFKAFVADYLPRLLWALVLLAVGYVVLNALAKAFKKLLKRSRVDATLHSFIVSMSKILGGTLLIILCLGILRVPLAPLVTALGTVGLAVSLAVKDSLANIAGGMSVLFNRPFAKGDLVEIKDKIGVVRRIELVYTLLMTDDDKLVYLPNGDVAKSVIINYTTEPLRRLDMQFSAEMSFEAAQAIILRVLQSSAFLLPSPAPVLRVYGQEGNMLLIICKVWAKQEHADELEMPLRQEIVKQLT